MEILFITKLFPYPPDAGGKLKTYKIFKILSEKHKIHLVSLVDKTDYSGSYCYTDELFTSSKIFILPIINQKNKIYSYFKFILSIMLNKPFTVLKYYSKTMQSYVKHFLKKNNIDLIYIDHVTMAQYLPDKYDCKIVCDEHNISHLAFEKYSKVERNILLKFIYMLESLKLKKFEERQYKRFNHIFTISKLDNKRLCSLNVVKKKTSFLPTPFDTHSCFSKSMKTHIITFIGLLSWLPNEIGIKWFIENVFPKIQEKLPNSKLFIYGKNGDGIKFLINKNIGNILYKGYVKNIQSAYKVTSVFIVPILMGGGIRIKLLDAMSHGIPIVSTSIGAEGVDVEYDKHLLIANNPDNFAKSVIKIIQDKKLANTLSRNSIDFIKENYNVKKTKKALSILEEL